MQVARTIEDVRQWVAAARRAGRTIGLAPTMGALHRAHLSLVEASRRDGHYTVVSIFVNPMQFGPNEDFSRYPRDEPGDLRACEAAGVDLVFAPDVLTMHVPDAVTSVRIETLTETLCGPFRPGHFAGVATVVAKLFNIVQPDAAYFGEKDAQQLAVVRAMVRDLNFPIRVVGCPTVREADGLALSSRNRYLTPPQREQATVLHRALQAARAQIHGGERDAARLEAAIRVQLHAAGPVRIDYVSIVDPVRLQPVHRVEGPVLLAIAVHIDGTRLIDNVTVDPASGNA